MVGKKVEGNEDQRRAAARQARRDGQAPSAQKETTGASKQRSHRPRHESHQEKVAALHQGKQGWQKDTEAGTSQQAAGYEQDKRFTGHQDYTDEHARVLTTAGPPIPGLYAAGNISATVMGRSYLGAGASIGNTCTFGYIAMKHLAEQAAARLCVGRCRPGRRTGSDLARRGGGCDHSCGGSCVSPRLVDK